MTAIDRRTMLRTLLGGAVAAAAGLALMPDQAVSAPLTIDKALTPPAETLVEKAAVVVHRHRRSTVVVHRRHHHRRHRRHVCWWHRGRRVCGWR